MLMRKEIASLSRKMIEHQIKLKRLYVCLFLIKIIWVANTLNIIIKNSLKTWVQKCLVLQLRHLPSNCLIRSPMKPITSWIILFYCHFMNRFSHYFYCKFSKCSPSAWIQASDFIKLYLKRDLVISKHISKFRICPNNTDHSRQIY